LAAAANDANAAVCDDEFVLFEFVLELGVTEVFELDMELTDEAAQSIDVNVGSAVVVKDDALVGDNAFDEVVSTLEGPVKGPDTFIIPPPINIPLLEFEEILELEILLEGGWAANCELLE